MEYGLWMATSWLENSQVKLQKFINGDKIRAIKVQVVLDTGKTILVIGK